MPNSKEEFLNTVKNGNIDVVRNFLENKESKEMLIAQDEDGRTALHLAAQRNHVEIAKLLLDTGADISAFMKDEGTPLRDAIANGHDGMVKLLLGCGANII